jgi:hypothetical protein
MKNLYCLYTLSKVTKSDKIVGLTHGSNNGFQTLCGEEITQNWWIYSNDHTEKPTCKKCFLEILNQFKDDLDSENEVDIQSKKEDDFFDLIVSGKVSKEEYKSWLSNIKEEVWQSGYDTGNEL